VNRVLLSIKASTSGNSTAAPRRRRRPLLWLAPSALLLTAVFAYPIVEIVRLSFTNASLVSGGERYTLHSYTALGAQGIAHVLLITAVFVGFSIVFQMLLGFFIALMLTEAELRGLKGAVVTRTAVMTAWAIPGVIIGIIWRLLYQESPSGVLNYLSTLAGLSGNTAFLSDPNIALVSVTVANIWRGTALTMILCYAGLKTVPRELTEAAHIDGASPFGVLRNIILPTVRPVLVINLILVTVETLNTFDMIQALTAGGPGKSTQVLALSVYSQVFGQQRLGQGAAFGVVLMAVNIVVVIGYLYLIQRREKKR
jgi:multiple sugar transport system permease protein